MCVSKVLVRRLSHSYDGCAENLVDRRSKNSSESTINTRESAKFVVDESFMMLRKC